MIDTLQWLRFIQVVVGKNGKGIDVRATHSDGLRIEFTVEKTIRATPNTGDITIYNLHPEDERLVLNEFDEVIVSAGYQRRLPTAEEYALRPELFDVHQVFRGTVKHSVAYWDKGDRKVDIQAADGDKDFREAIVNTVLAAGKSDTDDVREALRAMSNTKPGHIVTKGKQRTRARVISAPARDVLRKVAADNDAHWSIQDGFLQIVPSMGVLPYEAIIVNESTGLLGAPELSDKGVKVTTLLNPLIAINGKMLLNNQNIKIETKQLYTTGPKVKAKHLARLSPDGVYKVYKLRHEGDSRGEAKTISETVALGDAIPSTSHKAAMVHL